MVETVLVSINSLPVSFRKRINFTDSCWLWIGYAHPNGYGLFSTEKKQKGAHRVSWECFNGKIPNKLSVLHKCDVRHCVNPDHLFLGTQADNMADMKKKGRSTAGEKHAMAKLTPEQVSEIRSLYQVGKPNNQSEFSQNGLGVKFGVSGSQIRNIVKNLKWKKELTHENYT